MGCPRSRNPTSRPRPRRQQEQAARAVGREPLLAGFDERPQTPCSKRR